MLRIHFFSIFTIKTPRALATLAPLSLLIVKTLINVLKLLLTNFPFVADTLNHWCQKFFNSHFMNSLHVKCMYLEQFHMRSTEETLA